MATRRMGHHKLVFFRGSHVCVTFGGLPLFHDFTPLMVDLTVVYVVFLQQVPLRTANKDILKILGGFNVQRFDRRSWSNFDKDIIVQLYMGVS